MSNCAKVRSVVKQSVLCTVWLLLIACNRSSDSGSQSALGEIAITPPLTVAKENSTSSPILLAELTESSFVVGKWRLALAVKDGLCLLNYSNSESERELVLAPVPPCEFATQGPSKELQSFDFEAPIAQTILIVFGTAFTGAIPASWPKAYCGTVSQAILLREDELKLSERVAEGGLRCSGKAVDKLQFKMFNEG